MAASVRVIVKSLIVKIWNKSKVEGMSNNHTQGEMGWGIAFVLGFFFVKHGYHIFVK